MTITAAADESEPVFNREIKLAPDGAAVCQARDFVRAGLLALGLADERIEDGVLIASELVTNAIEAAPDSPFLVIVRDDDDAPVIEVHDCSAGLPRVRQNDLFSERGRGLPIVTALCREWKCVPCEGGKAIVAKLHRRL